MADVSLPSSDCPVPICATVSDVQPTELGELNIKPISTQDDQSASAATSSNSCSSSSRSPFKEKKQKNHRDRSYPYKAFRTTYKYLLQKKFKEGVKRVGSKRECPVCYTDGMSHALDCGHCFCCKCCEFFQRTGRCGMCRQNVTQYTKLIGI